MEIRFFGATREVTGSCYLVHIADRNILVECGLVQGSQKHELRNSDPFPFDLAKLDAVVLTHAHIDHSGRIPLLVKRGYRGPIYTHRATTDLCDVMLQDSAYLQEKDAKWENRKRERKGIKLVEPVYDREDARAALKNFRPLEYRKPIEIVPGVRLILRDAGHILGSAIVELYLTENGKERKVVFSGDLGHAGAPILQDPEIISQADLVIMESTYGDRFHHRSWEDTWKEMGEIITSTLKGRGNILIPAFTVGRTQELLYAFNQHYQEWGIGDWHIFLDSPMGIKATEIYSRHISLYDQKALDFSESSGHLFNMPNLHMSLKTADSMKINLIRSGAIIIAGSGMCTGGRIKHHLKHNIWRSQAHVIMVGFQAGGTPGRALVDGAKHIRLWGEAIKVAATIHTVGGLSAHADQQGLFDWYSGFKNNPAIVLVHGEPVAMDALAHRLKTELHAAVTCAEYGQTITL